mmetsp:Transcript_27004/g.64100  ORF Transcript_27004/g.64100 Transcript_27004/m.64100 type:complete len:292 (-) Transcript_27004:65-940(-)
MAQRAAMAAAAALLLSVCLLATVGFHKPQRSVLSQLPADYFVNHPGDSEGHYFNAHPTQYDVSGKPFAVKSKGKRLAPKLAQLPSDYFVNHPGDSEGNYFNAHPTQYDVSGKPFARRVKKMQLRSISSPSLGQIYPATPEWQTTPNSVGVGDGSVPGQDRNVFDGQYQFPDYARRGGEGYRLVYIPDGMLPQFKPTGAQQLWGGQYSSVGKFPVGYRGQITDGGEWNVWALPTEEQMAQGDQAGCPCAQYDSPLQSIDEINVLDDIGNDPDGAVWNSAAPAETTANCNCNK